MQAYRAIQNLENVLFILIRLAQMVKANRSLPAYFEELPLNSPNYGLAYEI
jgi:hypothetical protein